MKFQYKIVGLFSRGSLLSEGFLRMRFGELFFGEGGGELIIGILRYLVYQFIFHSFRTKLHN